MFNVKSRARGLVSRNPKLMLLILQCYALTRNSRVKKVDSCILISRGDNEVRLRQENLVYTKDVIEQFDSYFGAVVSQKGKSGDAIADFSKTAVHTLVGFDLFPVLLPGLPEPMETVEQYISLTGMTKGDVVLDLGAYSGISGLAFSEIVGENGRVISVEADPRNLECAKSNFELFQKLKGFSPTLVHAAIYSENGSVQFSSEGGLGSALASVQTRSLGALIDVPSMTLSELTSLNGINRVDVIKADIEGAEFAAFSDAEFFKTHHPRIVFEPALNHLAETSLESLVALLVSYGYNCSIHNQAGSNLPLVLAS